MMIKWPRQFFLASLLALTFFLSATAEAGTLNGTVINRTTGKTTRNIDLTFLSPTQGLREVASAKSDAQGRFAISNAQIGTAPILIRATFHGVSFNTFAPPGQQEVDVDVYDISGDIKTISIASHVVIFQPHSGKLMGAEEYQVQNASQPAAAYFRSGGNFDFAIPEEGTLGQVSAANSAMGMPVNQASIGKGNGRYAIAYPFRPGQTSVRLSYQLPYANASATVKLSATYPGVKMLLVVPPGVTVSGAGLTMAGKAQGMIVFTHDPLPANGVLPVSLSGQGSVADLGGQVPGQAPGNAQEGTSRTGPEVIVAPSRLGDFKWYLYAGLAALFAMGAVLLTRKQVVMAGGPGIEEASVAHTETQKIAAGTSATPAASDSHETSGGLEQHVGTSMDALKDQIFRLELRRNAGTISEEEYGQVKAQVEKVLQRLLRG